MLAVASLFIVLTWIAMWARFRETEPVEPPPRPAIRMWDVPGCYRVDVEEWPDQEAAPPPRVMFLVADSLDEYGREQETYRATALEPPGASAEYRWFVRADTLWMVWARSSGGLRGGIALRETSDGLLGRARVTGPDGSPDVSARARAWKVNCATREIEPRSRIRR